MSEETAVSDETAVSEETAMSDEIAMSDTVSDQLRGAVPVGMAFRGRQFLMQLRKEVWEHQTLFLGAPVVLALALFLLNVLVFQQLDPTMVQTGLEWVSRWFGGSIGDSAPVLSFLALPFLLLLFVTAVFYLSMALYSDRRDASILFWQSMPVSNLSNVLCKVVSVVLVMPVFTVLSMLAFYLATLLWLAVVTGGYEIELAMAKLLIAVLYNLVIVYFYAATSALWLLPVIGWLLLFSAFARRAPLLWAVGVYVLLGFIESFVFGGEVLSVWSLTRLDPDNFLIIEFGGILGRLFSYEMLIGLLAGSVLIAGAVLMRRFAD